MELDEMYELNKFENQIAKLNNNKGKRLKQILFKLRWYNLHFSHTKKKKKKKVYNIANIIL